MEQVAVGKDGSEHERLGVRSGKVIGAGMSRR